jgi:hypothetical protein
MRLSAPDLLVTRAAPVRARPPADRRKQGER